MHHAKHVFRNLTGFVALSALLGAVAAPAAASRNPLNGDVPPAVVIPASPSSTGLVNVVDPATLSCSQTTTFDDVPGGPAPGFNYDGIFVSVGVFFAERFVGQAVSYNGNFDVITGSPSNPLLLQAGAPLQNLNVFDYSTNVLTGLGPLGFPNFDAIGEGAIAMYFSAGQSQFAFQLVGGENGSATLDFYRADGSLIDTIVLSGLANTTYGFKRVDGTQDIAGVLIQNQDVGGIGLDNVCHDVGVVGTQAASWGNIKSLYR
jgi:hypothetical protein